MSESRSHGERPADSGVVELLRECVACVVGFIGSLWEGVGASDDDRGVGGGEEVGAEVCVASADDDWFEVVLERPVD